MRKFWRWLSCWWSHVEHWTLETDPVVDDASVCHCSKCGRSWVWFD